MTDAEIAQKLLEPRYFIERSFSIVDQSSREVPFLLNPLQSDYHANRTEKDIILKPRKAGFSSFILAEFLHACMTRMNTRAVVLSHEEGATKRLFRRVKAYLDSARLKVRVSKESESEYQFPDTKSWFYIGTAGSKSFGRGDDITHGHLSESAHYDNRDVVTNIQEALIKGAPTRLIQESTAKGAGTKFHEAWLKAINGTSNWRPHFYGWHQDPMNRIPGCKPFLLTDEERGLRDALTLDWDQLAWRRDKIANMEDPSLFPQEYPATWEEAFLAAGGMVFDWTAIKRHDDDRREAKWTGHILDKGGSIAIEPDKRGPLTVYLTPSPKARYLLVADSSQGIQGKDYSVADVYDIKTWEQVAQWRGYADPLAFSGICMRLGAYYGWALIAGENNYPGNAVLQAIAEAGYPNIWDEPEESGDELGWKTTEKSKSQFIADGRECLRDGSAKVNSVATLNEMRTFVLHDNGKMAAQQGCHDDTIITYSKATNLLKRLHIEPETRRESFREVMGFRKVGRGGAAGGVYNTGVV